MLDDDPDNDLGPMSESDRAAAEAALRRRDRKEDLIEYNLRCKSLKNIYGAQMNLDPALNDQDQVLLIQLILRAIG